MKNSIILKRLAAILVVIVLTVSLAACASSNEATPSNSTQPSVSAKPAEASTPADTQKAAGKKLKIMFLGNNFGDKSFMDSANLGIKMINEKLGDKVEAKSTDITLDVKKYKAALIEASEADNDIIIIGTFNFTDILQEVAPQYPDKKYILFDASVDFTKFDLKNVYAMLYKANESSYLSGMAAAFMENSKNQGISGKGVVGFVGGMDNSPGIQDFLVGFIEGAKAVNPNIKVVTSYVNDFADSAKAKELALVQFNSNNSDIVFAVAGGAGIGAIEAAAQVGKYAIGVDSDQSLMYEGKPEQKIIITSALKRVDNSIYQAVERLLAGTLPWGTSENLGVKEKCSGIVYNDVLKQYLDDASIKKIQDAEAQIADGSLKVTSAFDKTPDEIKAIINSVKP
jgi:basic membrane protein A